MNSYFLISIILLPGLLCLSGCGTEQSSDSQVLEVAVSVTPQAYLVERIGGPQVKVTTLVQAGESPATFQPSDRKITELMRTRIFFRIGVPFESGKWFGAMTASGQDIEVVDLRQGVELRAFGGCSGHDHEGCSHGTSGLDPHIWLGPEALRTMAHSVAEALIRVDGAHEKSYRANLERCLQDLKEAETEAAALLAPHRGKRIYVFHPAWGYFCDAFGLEQVALEQEGKSPTDEELTRLQARIEEDRARVLFVQPQIAGSAARTAAEAMGIECVPLDPLATDPIDNLTVAARIIAESLR